MVFPLFSHLVRHFKIFISYPKWLFILKVQGIYLTFIQLGAFIYISAYLNKLQMHPYIPTIKFLIIVENRFMAKRFLIYGFAGWCMEIIWTGLHSLITGNLKMQGYTSMWMFLIYGCAVFLEPIHDIIKRWRWYTRGIIWVVLIWGMEYTSGFIMIGLLGIAPWHYLGPFAIDNLVRIDYAPAWFAAGLIFESMHKKLDIYDIV